MEFTETDRLSILNPIIDEIGVISKEAKNNVITQISAQLNRILVSKYKDEQTQIDVSLKSITQNIESISNRLREIEIDIENISAMQNELQNQILSICDFLRSASAFLNSLDKKIDSLTKAIIESKNSMNEKEDVVTEEYVEKKNNEQFSEDELSKMSFSELVKLAKSKGVTIQPRIKKSELISLLLSL